MLNCTRVSNAKIWELHTKKDRQVEPAALPPPLLSIGGRCWWPCRRISLSVISAGKGPRGIRAALSYTPACPTHWPTHCCCSEPKESMLHCSRLLGQHTFTLPTKCRASVWGFRPRAAVSWWQFYSAWSLLFRHMSRARDVVPFCNWMNLRYPLIWKAWPRH